MMTKVAHEGRVLGRAFTKRSLIGFFVASFVLSWGMGIAYVIFQEPIEKIFGKMGYTNPVFILMVYAPGIVGVAMVWRHAGIAGLRSFFRRFTLWRMPLIWWLVLLLGLPAVYYAGAALVGNNMGPEDVTSWSAVLPALAAMLLIGPIEELGWRGIALPLLQRRWSPLWASLILGLIAAVWHAPSFLLSGTKQSGWAFWPFFFGVIAISVILTVMFNASGGSLLIAFLFHAQVNGPFWPNGQPWDMWLFVAAAVVIAVVNRRRLLDRGQAVTSVVENEAGRVTGRFDGERPPTRER
ncbi:MAG: type II CAAX endopeptidase family protein [Antricoccus sp.]